MFTDRFGSPLAVGDKIVVALHSGRSSAELREVTIAALIPLIPHWKQNEPKMEKVYDSQRKEWVKTGKVASRCYMREDQQAKLGPREFWRDEGIDPSKLFVLQYEYTFRNWRGDYEETRKQAFDRVTDVVKVPNGV